MQTGKGSLMQRICSPERGAMGKTKGTATKMASTMADSTNNSNSFRESAPVISKYRGNMMMT